MPSPFPGMNPYLEKADRWSDFHNRFVAALAEALTPGLVPRYFARIEEYLYIRELSAEERQFLGRPDVSVHRAGPAGPASGGAAVAAPSSIGPPPEVDIERITYLEVRDRADRAVVTVIELLSPANKHVGPDRAQYLQKLARVLRSTSNLVEIDLLRGGPRTPWADLPPCDYHVAVSRYSDRSRVDSWPIRLRDRLPEIPIPLRAGEPEPTLDLQALLHRVYDAAGYEFYVYDKPPAPALSAADAAWAAGLAPRPPGVTGPG